MAMSYSNCFQLPKVSSKCHLVCSTTRLSTRAFPVYACLQSSDPTLLLEAKVDPLLDSVKWVEKALAVAIAQNVDTGAVLMQVFVNRDALLTTISSRKATFYSRSRSTLWTKGETSNNFINICDIFTIVIVILASQIIYLGKPDGLTCHTGSDTCYYTSVNEVLNDPQVNDNKLASTTLYSLESTISNRKDELSASPDMKPSWTKRLLLNDELLCSEEADELCRTLEEYENQTRTASEMADLLYHSIVLLGLRKESKSKMSSKSLG